MAFKSLSFISFFPSPSIKKMKNILLALFCLITIKAVAQNAIADKPGKKDFPISTTDTATPIVYDIKDDSLVSIAARLFSDDVERVTGKRPAVQNTIDAGKDIIIIGTLEKSAFIQELIAARKLDVSTLKGQ